MLGLPGLVVLAAGEYGGELELLVETTPSVTGCPACGVVAIPHSRRDHLVRDIPATGRPVLLVWRKRLWRCDEPLCTKRTWSESTPWIGRHDCDKQCTEQPRSHLG
jgi:transposase